MSLREDAFDALYKDLIHIRPEYEGLNVILCPICLRAISRGAILQNGVEHIIPKTIVKQDSPQKACLGSRNQRCGITVLCRTPRVCKSNAKIYENGCNGLKGSFYDRLWKKYWGNRPIDRQELTHRHGVSILIMAYLGAFQIFGYEYILQNSLDDIREQFDFPDETRTDWAYDAIVDLRDIGDSIIATDMGHPFIFGGVTADGYPLQLLFRRFTANLPSGHWHTITPVSSLASIMPSMA